MSPDTPYRIEPCFPSTLPTELVDVVTGLSRVSAVLGQRLHPITAASLVELVRVMNCYYSNLIEGHNTRPRDIERALEDVLETEGERRDLQLEALAHIRVQREVDALCARGEYGEPAAAERLRWLHGEF